MRRSHCVSSLPHVVLAAQGLYAAAGGFDLWRKEGRNEAEREFKTTGIGEDLNADWEPVTRYRYAPATDVWTCRQFTRPTAPPRLWLTTGKAGSHV